jgi:hypothetical protein
MVSMLHSTQLLCTFSATDLLDITLKQIVSNYQISFETIYVLENVDTPDSLCCTYNIPSDSLVGSNVPEATISLHRKKATNTLYTINALNALVSELNGGVADKRFLVPWDDYRNTILVTAYGKLKRINTKLNKIVKVSDIK